MKTGKAIKNKSSNPEVNSRIERGVPILKTIVNTHQI